MICELFSMAVAAGMAGARGGQWQKNLEVDSVSIPAKYAFLRVHGVDNLVDGYGVHDYPPVVKPGHKANAMLSWMNRSARLPMLPTRSIVDTAICTKL